jgi:hypothetical protein
LADGAAVAARQRNAVDVVKTEQTDSAMFFADAVFARVTPEQAVSDDDYLSLRKHLIDPAIEEWPGLDTNPELLADLTHQASLGRFSRLEPASLQFPFTALVLQQHNLAAVAQNSLY